MMELSSLFVTWGVVALALLLVLWLAWPLLRRWRNRRRMERCIAANGIEQLRDVLLEDGMGGMVFYEWLLLTPREIRVLVTSRREGIIFAGERMDNWAQVVGKRTTHFANPLRALESMLASLRYHLPGLSVEGHVLFIGECSFPKGRPESVLTLEDLASAEAVSGEQAVQPVLEEGWSRIKAAARKVDPAVEGYLLPVTPAPAYGRWALIVLLLGATAGWLYWRLWA